MSASMFALELYDYSIPVTWFQVSQPALKEGVTPTPAAPESLLPQDLLSQWIRVIRADDSMKDKPGFALKKFQETKSNAWLLAAMMTNSGKLDPNGELAKAFAKVSSRDPGYLVLAYYAGNAGLEIPLDEILARNDLVRGTRNHFLSLALRKDPKSLPVNGPRQIAGESLGCESAGDLREALSESNETRLDTDGAEALNRLSIPEILEIKNAWSKHSFLSKRLGLIAWTRAHLLDDAKLMDDTTKLVAADFPDIAAEVQESLEGSLKDRKRSALFFMLKYPIMHRDYFVGATSLVFDAEERSSYETNWWCKAKAGNLPEELTKTHIAPKYFLTEVLAWAKEAPADPRIPEALALAVQSHRWGCCNSETLQLAKNAFKLLQTKYKGSDGAKSTATYAACESPVREQSLW
jgi:hypothetical protein